MSLRLIERLRRNDNPAPAPSSKLSTEMVEIRERLRSAPLSQEDLVEHARYLAQHSPLQTEHSGGRELYQRLSRNERTLQIGYGELADLSEHKKSLPAGGEWILDNFHIIEDHIREIREHVPRKFHRTLPILAEGRYAGQLRVYSIAVEYLSRRNSIVQLDLMSAFVSAYQESAVLTMGELWAIPAMLRVAVVENLALLLEENLNAFRARQSAEELAEEILRDEKRPGTEILIDLASALEKFQEWPGAEAIPILRALRSRGRRTSVALHWLEERFRERGLDPEEMMRVEQHTRAMDEITVGSCITSLRTLSNIDWREWFEHQSHVDKVLANDPAGTYRLCDFKTRDLYRHRLEILARRTKRSEPDVASALVEFANREGDASPDRREIEVTRRKHVGYHLVDDGREEFERYIKYPLPWLVALGRALKREGLLLYLSSILGGSFLVALAWFMACRGHGTSLGLSIFTALLVWLVTTEFTTHLTQWVVSKLVPPTMLPKLDFKEGVPDQFRTVVAVHGIFGDRESVRRAVEALEVRFLGNDDPNVLFALLADHHDADREELSVDDGLVQHGVELVRDLNKRHYPGAPERFFLLFRKRLSNPSQGRFMGWERKRGKIEEFNRFLLGNDATSFRVCVGEAAALRSCHLVITLDTDSQLPRGSAAKLVGVSAHPLNRPMVDPETHTVKKGYGLLQPRVSPSLTSANYSLFSRLFCGPAGLDPYTSLISDVYQDLFGEGSYVGKGLYDVAAFQESLGGRVPENALLSHDLFEGIFARSALVSDVELIDEFPSRYHVFSRREHRWARGDWQLLPWVVRALRGGSRVHHKMSALGVWKLVDNLRRSLIPPAQFLLLTVVCALLPAQAQVALLLVCATLFAPLFTSFANALAIPTGDISLGGYMRQRLRDLLNTTLQAALQFIFLPHRAAVYVHAIVVTLWRLCCSRRNLLEWESADHSERRLGTGVGHFMREMLDGILLAAVFGNVIAWLYPQGFLGISPLLLAWFSGPFLAAGLSVPLGRRSYRVSSGARETLLDVGFRTWSYFDDLIRPEDNYLIPDNIQLVPTRVLAQRTSPTNIGLSIMAVVSAYDLGFIHLPEVLDRVGKVLTSLDKLERWNGHLLNWYDTRSLVPLAPRYVSTVDSGNLVGHFMATRGAMRELVHAPILSERHLAHLHRALTILSVDSPVHRDLGAECREILKGLPHQLTSFDQVNAVIANIKRLVTARGLTAQTLNVESTLQERMIKFLVELAELNDLFAFQGVMSSIASAVDATMGATPDSKRGKASKSYQGLKRILGGRAPTLSLLAKVLNRLREIATFGSAAENGESALLSDDVLRTLNAAIATSSGRYEQLVQKIEHSTAALTRNIDQIELKHLYDHERKAFFIGYNVDTARYDSGHYDLLASEARLASFVAIARGEVGQQHWFTLSRALTDSSGGKALISWSATMFEYLMPILVMHDYPGTILSETYVAVVNAQRIYGARRRVPWGISESAYAGVDFHKTYQYRAFGVPGLGLKRGLSDDLVISPYSTFLALPIEPRLAIKNIAALKHEGLEGVYGFYEAIDYTPQRLSAGERGHVVCSFLAHHQGMSLVSINNFLNGSIFQNRFHSEPEVKATCLLLQERFPYEAPVIEPHRAEQRFFGESDEGREAREVVIRTPHTATPRGRIFSNGAYSVLIDNAGSGYSFFHRSTALTRWQEDAINNSRGMFFFYRDAESQAVWSAGYQPTRVEAESYEVIFDPAKAEIRRRDNGIVSALEVTVSPEDNVEIRNISLSNVSGQLRKIEVTSFAEVVLGSAAGDAAHPAFAKMFVESEWLPELETIIFSRRRRSDTEQPLFFFHMLTMPVCWTDTQFESSREAFIGRGNSVHEPGIFASARPLEGRQGSVLDPVAVLRTRVDLTAGATHSVKFVSGAAHSREDVLRLVQRYREIGAVSRAFELAASHSNIELRHQQFSIAQSHAFQRLANALLFSNPGLRGDRDLLARNVLAQAGLWRFGISGDVPIVLLSVSEQPHIAVVQELLLAHQYLRLRGIVFDLVILNAYPGGYFQNFQQDLEFVVKNGVSGGLVEKNGGVFLRTATQLSEEETTLLNTVARVVLQGTLGSLVTQLDARDRREVVAQRRRRREQLPAPAVRKSTQAKAVPLEFSNRFGGFCDNGRAYQITVENGEYPPAPWSNVVSNPHFGFIVTESGGGYTWSENSRENRLTPWSNDPVSDPLGEAIYIRDTGSGALWSPTPKPVATNERFVVKHGLGFTQFSSVSHDIASELTISGAPHSKVKWWNLKLSNKSQEPRRLEIYLYVEWVMGVLREQSSRFVVTGFDDAARAVFAKNTYNNEFAGRIAAIGCSNDISSYTASRDEFVGRNRDVGSPQALDIRRGGVSLSRTTGAALDPCGVIQTTSLMGPGEEREILFYITEAANIEELRSFAPQARARRFYRAESDALQKYWGDITSTVQIKTPERSFDLMMNSWLLYQTLSCRIYGRSAFYQSGGAIGFRDQLQDVLSLLPSMPAMTRQQIILHASRQFVEGDVQHWWHPPTGRGVRTRISDDLLFLPYAVSRYLETTGDASVVSEEVGFLEGQRLDDKHAEAYFVPQQSMQRGSIYDHCVRAIERSLPVGSHGLPFIGCGDWNDGMNEVGREGRGESVWLAWFLIDVLKRFIPLAETRGETDRVMRYRAKIDELKRAIETHAWDGAWYRRGFYDDGTPLGSAQCDDCQIDSLAQSWAVITGEGDPARARQGMDSALEKLVKRDPGMILLLTPPFDKGTHNPGYIKGYLPGIRENGAQYTHAATWVIMAAARLGLGSSAYSLFHLINPINHTASNAGVARYGGEPYVMAGDVYSNPTHLGRCGWSWYTGSSGWLYQIGLQEILGLSIGPNSMTIAPCVPATWKEFSLTYHRGETTYEIRIENPHGVERGVQAIEIDGALQPDKRVAFQGREGTVRVRVVMGA